jgi:hypothetical protein
MLTPLGAGGRRRSRRRLARTALTVVLVLLLAGAAAAATWWWFTQRDTGNGPAQGAPTVVCTTPTPRPPRNIPRPADVQVGVLNGTNRAGLAISTADELALAGFDVIAIGNSPKPVDSGVAVIGYAPKAEAGAVRLASYLPGATLRRETRRKDTMIELRLGPDYASVASAPQARRALKNIQLPPLSPRCHTQPAVSGRVSS